MTPKDFKKAREGFGLTQAQFARMLGAASDRTVRRWEEGERAVPGSVALLIWLAETIPAANKALMKIAAGEKID